MLTFIGDVHGWPDRLERVLEQSRGGLVFLGDLVDRGPDSAAVVARVRGLCAQGRARAVMGNHEFAMLRGLGLPERGIPGDPALYEAWIRVYGGDATAESYGVPEGGARLRTAALEDLRWMAGLPWYLAGSEGGHPFIACHAGLDRRPLSEQLAGLDDHDRHFRPGTDLPVDLYLKNRSHTVPEDLPERACVISGHVPMEEPLILSHRVVIDTTGGLPDRRLTGYLFPLGRVIQS